ncbi:MAG: MFS transporter [bacterium]|nr:MFS transporter [bacterium]
MTETNSQSSAVQNKTVDQKLEWALNRSIVEGSFYTVMDYLIGGVFITGFALEFGANNFYLGLIAAIPPFISLLQLFTPPILRQFGGKRKELTVFSFGISRIVWLIMILLPFMFVPSTSPTYTIWIIISVLCVFNGLNAIGVVSWLSWMSDLVPRERLGRYFAKRNFYIGIVGRVTALAGGLLYDAWKLKNAGKPPIFGFSFIFLIGLICGLISVYLLKGIPEPQMVSSPQQDTPWKKMFIPLKDKNFRRYILTRMFWIFALMFASPYFNVFMIKKLNLQYTIIQTFGLIGAGLALACSPYFGKLCDRYGNKPVLILTYIVKGFYCFAWLFVTPNNYWITLTITRLFFCLDIAMVFSASNLLYKISPKSDNTAYMATYTTCMNLSSFLAPIIAGWMTLFAKQNDMFTFGGYEIDSLKLIFLIAGVLRIIAAPMLFWVHEPESVSLRDMMRGIRKSNEHSRC